MAKIYKRNGKWYARFQHKGEDYRRSTGVEVKKGKGAAEARDKAQAALERMMAEVRGGESAEALFARLNEAIDKMPASEGERKRIAFSERLRDGVTAHLEIVDAWDAWLKTPKKRSPSRQTVEMYHAYWGRDQVKKHGKKRKNGFKSWLAENHPGVKALHEITPDIAEEYATHLWGTGIAPRTYNGTIKFLRSMFKVLSVRAGLTKNVWDDIPTMENQTESRRNLTEDELKEVCATATGDLRYWIALGLYSGLRLSDVVTLKWNEIDFKTKTIKRVPRKTRRKGKKLEIPLHPVLESLLLEHRRTAKKSEYLFPDAAAAYDKNGATTLTKRIQEHFKSCGIETTEEPGEQRKKKIVRVGFHSLRHSFVSLCAANKVPQVAIQQLVGHGSPAMTELYAHANKEQQQAAIEGLPAMFRDADDGE